MMALETSRLNFQLQNFSRVLTENAVNLEQYTKNTGQMLSLASQIKALHTFEKKHECQIDAPTSGESSPCQSDSEIESRFLMPTLQEISDLLTDELALEVDAAPEKFKGFHGRDLTLVFEDFDTGFQKNRFYRYLKETRYSNYISDKIAYPREMKSICFRGNNSLLVNICVRKPDLLGGLMDTFHSILKKETRRPVKMYKVVEDRRAKEAWFGVIMRNLPPKVTQKELTNQCQREVTGQITIGTLIKVKDRHCCIVRCEYLEDAEIICKKLNNFQLKDPTTNMKYILKVHIHPQSAHRHSLKDKDKSLFSDFIQTSEKPKGGKTGIADLLKIFTSSKKTSEKHKPPPPPPIGGPQKKESMEEEKSEAAPANGMDTFLKRIYSSQTETQVKPQSVSKETEDTQATSVFTKMIKQSGSEGGTAEGEGRGSQEGSLNGKEGIKEEKENRMGEEMKSSGVNLKGDNFGRKNYEGNVGKFSMKKEYDEKRYDKRNERSSSRHDRRKNYEKNDHASRRGSKYDQGRDYDRQKKHRSHKDSRDRKRNHSRSRVSKSKSRSKSRSRSKNRVKGRRNNDYDSKNRRNKGDFDKSPKRSSSPNKKKYISKRSKSRSVSNKSRSRSVHRDKYKDDKGKNKPVTLYEYEHKENRSDGSRSLSASKKKKRRDSGSRSHDRGKRRHDKSPQKSFYSNRDKYHDNHKDSYHRKDNRDLKNQSDYKSSHRKGNYYSRNEHHYDDKQRRRNRDNDRPHHRDRSRSKASRSVNRHSHSRSRSSRGSKERRRPDSIDRKEQRPLTAGNDGGNENPKENN